MFTLCSKCVDPWRSKLHCSRVAESKSRRENKLTKPPPSSFFLLLLLPFFYSAGRAIYIKQDPILAAAVGGQPVRESPCSPPALFLVTGQLQTATLSYFCPYTFFPPSAAAAAPAKRSVCVDGSRENAFHGWGCQSVCAHIWVF